MRVQAVVVALMLLLAACQPVRSAPTVIPTATQVYTSASCPAGDHPQELTTSGQVRQYILHVPTAYQPETSMALVLGFHGAGSNAREFERYSDFSFLANIEGFIVAYPQALGKRPTWDTTPGPNNPDLQFVTDLIDDLQSRCNIDPNRIYASGHSNGGGLANRLACDLSDRIAAIGTVAGAYQGSEECLPTEPVAVLGIHGTDDPIIPYNGFQDVREPPAAYYLIGVPIPQWASSWAKRNGCDREPASTTLNDKVSNDRWSNCSEAANVILYTIHGGGHEWPNVFEPAQLIWNFFAEH